MVDSDIIRIRESMRLGHYAQAAQLAKTVFHDAPQHLTICLLLTECYLNLAERNIDAQIMARKAIAINDRSSRAHALFAQALLSSTLGNFTKTALKHLHRSIDLDPQNQLANLLLRNCGESPEVSRKKENDLVKDHHFQGVKLYHSQQFEEAEVFFLKALEIDPQFAAAWCNLADSQYQMGKLDEAKANYLKAFSIDSRSMGALNGLGNVYDELGQFAKAETKFLSALKMDQKQATPWNGLGVVQKNMGQFSEAEASFFRVLKIKPQYARAWVNLGFLYKKYTSTRDNDFNTQRCFNRFFILKGHLDDRIIGIKILRDHSNYPLLSWEFIKDFETSISEGLHASVLQPILEIKRLNFRLAMAGKSGLKVLPTTHHIDRIYLLHLYGDPIKAYSEALDLWRHDKDNLNYAALAWFISKEVLDIELAKEILHHAFSQCSQIAKGCIKGDGQTCFSAGLILREMGKNDLALEALLQCESGTYEYPARWLRWEILNEVSPPMAGELAEKITLEETRRLIKGKGLRDFPLSLPLGINNLPGGDYTLTNNWPAALTLSRHLMLQEILANTMITFYVKIEDLASKNVENNEGADDDPNQENEIKKTSRPWQGPANVSEWVTLRQLQVIADCPYKSLEKSLDQLVASYERDENVIPFLKPPDRDSRLTRVEHFALLIKENTILSDVDTASAIKALHTLNHRNHLNPQNSNYGDIVAYIVAKRSWDRKLFYKKNAAKTIPVLGLQLLGAELDTVVLTSLISSVLPAFDISQWFKGIEFPHFDQFRQLIGEMIVHRDYQAEIQRILHQFRVDTDF
ncbi:MAG: tetratricopeptide repeat protein [Akkermansiaceae bacterium]